MQYYTAKDRKSWIKALFHILFALNNSLNAATEYASNKINFDMKTKNLFVFMNNFVNEKQKKLHSYQ